MRLSMDCSSHRTSLAVLRTCSLWILLAVPVASTHAEIYKCPGHKAMTVYQNFPCEFASLGSMPAGAAAASERSTSTALGVASVHSNPVRNPEARATRADSAVQATATNTREPYVGMSEDVVRKVWGEPDEIIQDEPPSGRVDIWRYKGGRSVQINRTHRVIAVQL